MNLKSYLLAPGSYFWNNEDNSGSEDSQSGNSKLNASTLKFDVRLLQILTLLKDIHRLKNRSDDFSIIYLVELFENEISEKKKSLLIREIKKIGYEKLKATFEKINIECECYLCESENLFGILKRRQFRKEIPDNDIEKLKQIIQFLHITLIHINILYHSRVRAIPEKIATIKNKAFVTLEPFVNRVEEVLDEIFNSAIIDKKYFVNYETIHTNRNNNYNDDNE